MNQDAQGDAPHALVVDDDFLILMDATSILEDAGFQVLEARNVAQALEVLATHHEAVQLLFTDVHMPGGADGFELARKTAESWPHIAVVIASGNAKPGPGDMPEGATFMRTSRWLFAQLRQGRTLRERHATRRWRGRLSGRRPLGMATWSQRKSPESAMCSHPTGEVWLSRSSGAGSTVVRKCATASAM